MSLSLRRPRSKDPKSCEHVWIHVCKCKRCLTKNPPSGFTLMTSSSVASFFVQLYFDFVLAMTLTLAVLELSFKIFLKPGAQFLNNVSKTCGVL